MTATWRVGLLVACATVPLVALARSAPASDAAKTGNDRAIAGGPGSDYASVEQTIPGAGDIADTPVTTDDQFEEVTRAVEPDDPVDEDGRRALEVRGEFGRGLLFTTNRRSFAVQIRARAQLQIAAQGAGGIDRGVAQVRRMRLLFGGHALGRLVTFYMQLGFSDRGLEDDLPVPLRDAFATAHFRSWFNLRAGQMKVPFDRQRVTSSSKLQLVERARVVDALNLDRDIGLQAYGQLPDINVHYFVGVFAGEGRNRVNEDSGLLYIGRLRWYPFGSFDDAHETDLKREGRLRLAVSGAFGWNNRAKRTRSTQGPFWDDGSVDYLHAAGDVFIKLAGFSFNAQCLLRKATRFRGGAGRLAEAEGPAPSVWGAFLQTGYLFEFPIEVVARIGGLRAFDRFDQELEELELTGGVSWYVVGHDLKVQLAHTAALSDGPTEHAVRLQTQLFF